MFGPPGLLYCYFVYGMHVCANVVTGPDGEAGAVLLRAGEVIERREPAGSSAPAGPARLCRTLGITLEDNGTDLRRRPGHPGARGPGAGGRGQHRPPGRAPGRGRHPVALLADRRAQRLDVPPGGARRPRR